MFNKRTLTIIKRELRARLLSKSFILMTVLIPVFLFGILAIQTYIMGFEEGEKYKIEIVSESQDLNISLRIAFVDNYVVKEGNLSLTYSVLDSAALHEHLTDIKQQILDEKISGVVFVPNTALNNKEVYYYSKNAINKSLFDKLRGTINQVLVDNYFKDKQLSPDEISFARNNVDFTGFKVSEKDTFEEEGGGNMALAFLFTMLLYFSLIFLGTMMMRSVVEEKNNKIVEVLLSSLKSKELLTGKILGMAITGLVQMAIWLLPVFVLISTTWFILPPELTLSIGLGHLLYFLFNFFIALVTFLGLFATVGSIFDNDQDAQSGVWPIMILIMIPFFIAISMITNPASEIAKIASYIPFASLIVMPARMTIMEVQTWQIGISVIINIAVMLGLFPLAGKIYRVGILSTGKKPKWSEVIKWLKYKY